MKKRFALIFTLASIAGFTAACAETTTDSNTCGMENATRCNSIGVPEICFRGNWTAQSACSAGTKCVNGRCDPITVACKDNDKQCSSTNIPQVCMSGKWVDQTACTADQKCSGGSCIPKGAKECDDGAKQCSDTGIPQKCEAGSWVNQTACAADTQVCDKASGECKSSCVESECAGASNYVGSACIDIGGKLSCGCESKEHCKEGQICVDKACRDDTDVTICTGKGSKSFCDNGTHVTCEDSKLSVSENCASGQYVMGRLCIEEEGDDAESFCGCQEDSDCTSDQYECDKTNKYCTPKKTDTDPDTTTGCKSDDDCSAMTGDDYVGDYCMKSTGKCRCTATKYPCRSGYTCSSTNQCVAGAQTGDCDPAQCKADTKNTDGNACVKALDSTDYVCGCKDNSDCNSGYVCNTHYRYCEKSASTGDCDAAKCKADTSSNYQGNVCIDFYKDGSYSCGCLSQSDCNSGYECDTFYKYCKKETTCDAAKCKAMTGDAYTGNVCVINACGCRDQNDCNAGYECAADNYCKPASTSTSICAGIVDYTPVCDSTDTSVLVWCNDGEEEKREKCSTMSDTVYSGNICISDFDYCGCNSNSDCKTGYTCKDNFCEQSGNTDPTPSPKNLTVTFNSTNFGKTCADIQKTNPEVKDCKTISGTDDGKNYILTYNNGIVLELNSNALIVNKFSLYKSEHYIKASNLSAGSKVVLSNNAADAGNVYVVKDDSGKSITVTAPATSGTLEMGSTATSFELNHGAGTGAIRFTKLKITAP